MKNQKDLLYGEAEIKYKNIHRLFSNLLEKIIELREDFMISNITLYQSLNGTNDWNPENEDLIVYLKQCINMGAWDSIEEIIELDIIVDLLFDWLEDCVKYVINPKKILKLSMIRGFDSNLAAFVSTHTSGVSIDKKLRRDIIDFIKFHFNACELETLITISQFLALIHPSKESNEEHNEFLLVVDRLSRLLLGFNIQDLNDITSINCLNVERLKKIICLTVYVIINDLEEIEDEDNFFSIGDNSNQSHNSSFFLRFTNKMSDTKDV